MLKGAEKDMFSKEFPREKNFKTDTNYIPSYKKKQSKRNVTRKYFFQLALR